MNLEAFFSILLSLSSPFLIEGVKQIEENGVVVEVEINIRLDSKDYLPSGAVHVQTLTLRRWRHLNIMEYPCYLVFEVPCYLMEDGSYEQLKLPWARAQSGFTLIFEMQILEMIGRYQNVHQVAKQLKINDQKIWYLFDYYTSESKLEVAPCKKIQVDETSLRKGHNYITVITNAETGEIIFIHEGRDSEVIKIFAEKYSWAQEIEWISCDMSPAFGKGFKSYLQKAEIVYDKFHLVQHVHKDGKKLRKKEYKNEPTTLTEQFLLAHYQCFRNLWDQKLIEDAIAFLTWWVDSVEEMGRNDLAKSLRNHFEGIINFFKCPISNGFLEGLNNKIQTIKKIGRGYKNVDHFEKMILLSRGQIQTIS